MKKSVEFVSPVGERIVDPPAKWLQEQIKTGDETYWAAGSGQAVLLHAQGNERVQLVLMFSPAAGFHLMYVDKSGVRYVSVVDDNRSRVEEVYVGGDPMRVPFGWFVSRSLTQEAVVAFVETGTMTPAVPWVRRKGLNWEG